MTSYLRENEADKLQNDNIHLNKFLDRSFPLKCSVFRHNSKKQNATIDKCSLRSEEFELSDWDLTDYLACIGSNSTISCSIVLFTEYSLRNV